MENNDLRTSWGSNEDFLVVRILRKPSEAICSILRQDFGPLCFHETWTRENRIEPLLSRQTMTRFLRRADGSTCFRNSGYIFQWRSDGVSRCRRSFFSTLDTRILCFDWICSRPTNDESEKHKAGSTGHYREYRQRRRICVPVLFGNVLKRRCRKSSTDTRISQCAWDLCDDIEEYIHIPKTLKQSSIGVKRDLRVFCQKNRIKGAQTCPFAAYHTQIF